MEEVIGSIPLGSTISIVLVDGQQSRCWSCGKPQNSSEMIFIL